MAVVLEEEVVIDTEKILENIQRHYDRELRLIGSRVNDLLYLGDGLWYSEKQGYYLKNGKTLRRLGIE